MSEQHQCGTCTYYNDHNQLCVERGWTITSNTPACSRYVEDTWRAIIRQERAKTGKEMDKLELSPDKKKAIIQVYQVTSNIKETAEKVGVSNNAVRNHLRKAGIPTPRQNKPRDKSAPDIEALRQQLRTAITFHEAALETAQKTLTAIEELQRIYENINPSILSAIIADYKQRLAKIEVA